MKVLRGSGRRGDHREARRGGRRVARADLVESIVYARQAPANVLLCAYLVQTAACTELQRNRLSDLTRCNHTDSWSFTTPQDSISKYVGCHAGAIGHTMVMATTNTNSPLRSPLPLPTGTIHHLEGELVRELTLREAEARLDVLLKVLRLLDRSDNGSINRLLVCGLRLRERSLLRLALLEELLLCRTRALLRVLRKVRVADLLVNLTFRSAIRLPTPYSPSKLNPQGLDVNE